MEADFLTSIHPSLWKPLSVWPRIRTQKPFTFHPFHPFHPMVKNMSIHISPAKAGWSKASNRGVYDGKMEASKYFVDQADPLCSVVIPQNLAGVQDLCFDRTVSEKRNDEDWYCNGSKLSTPIIGWFTADTEAFRSVSPRCWSCRSKKHLLCSFRMVSRILHSTTRTAARDISALGWKSP